MYKRISELEDKYVVKIISMLGEMRNLDTIQDELCTNIKELVYSLSPLSNKRCTIDIGDEKLGISRHLYSVYYDGRFTPSSRLRGEKIISVIREDYEKIRPLIRGGIRDRMDKINLSLKKFTLGGELSNSYTLSNGSTLFLEFEDYRIMRIASNDGMFIDCDNSFTIKYEDYLPEIYKFVTDTLNKWRGAIDVNISCVGRSRDEVN